MKYLLIFTLSWWTGLSLYAQGMTVEDDFEGNGTISSWFGDNCGLDIARANPFPGGINTSPTVLEYSDTGGPYANVRFDVPYNFDLSDHRTFTLKVYVPSSGLTGNQPLQLSVKLQDGNLQQPWTTQSEIIKPLLPDQWQVLSFDFGSDPYINLDPGSLPPIQRSDFNRVLLQVNGENNTDQVLAYLDDVYYDGTVSKTQYASDSLFNLLVWADEFDQDGPVDDTKWHHQTQLLNGVSWANNELQHYTNRLANSYVEDGFLYLVARRETFTDQGQTKNFTSARLNSKMAFTNGRVEARAKLPTGVGTWPAIWMLGKNISERGGYWYPQFGNTPWPACGEIDIMEHWGDNQNYFSSALHTPCSFGNTVNVGGIVDNNVSDAFHVYAVEWYQDSMTFSLDGKVYYTYQPDTLDDCTWPFAEQYLLLNVAMVGAVDPAFTSSPMVIDYVRVYQEGTNTSAEPAIAPEWAVFPNPSSGTFRLELPRGSSDFTVTLTDLAGRQRYTAHYRQQPILDLALDLEPGLYFLSVYTAGNRVTKKVVIY